MRSIYIIPYEIFFLYPYPFTLRGVLTSSVLRTESTKEASLQTPCLVRAKHVRPAFRACAYFVGDAAKQGIRYNL